MKLLGVLAAVLGSPILAFTAKSETALAPQIESQIIWVKSKDGTAIAIERAGRGPSLVIVHGGIGDHTRWKPLFPFLVAHFSVCAMDRHGHGVSGDSPNYSLQKEAEDVAAVIDSRPAPVFLIGHSYGAVCALEAAFLTDKLSKLVLYEPPVQERNRSAVAAHMENMIRAGERELALVTFLQDIVMISPRELEVMRSRPSWPSMVAGIKSQIRQIRALDAYRFDAKRLSALKIPTLLLTGSKTASPDLKRAIDLLMTALPNRSLFIFEGQEHNAMDTVPQQFAEAVTKFLLDAKSKAD